MVIFFHCNINNSGAVEAEVKCGMFAARFRLTFGNNVLLAETKRSKHVKNIDFCKGADAYKLINVVLTAGLPPVDAISIIRYNLRITGCSQTRKSIFIINLGLTHNTITANSYVAPAKLHMCDACGSVCFEFDSAIKIKFTSILPYVTRILFAR